MAGDTLAVLGGAPVRTRPWPRWPQAGPATVDAVTDVLMSARWAVSGPYDGRICYERRFAAAFAAFHGVPYCTPTASGTAALTIALQALGVGHGDEVLVPGLTWVACASAVLNIGAVPVLVDCDPDTLCMSPALARAACTPRTAAILIVHLFCSVADLDAFPALSRELGVPLVEDCAQAHGARWRGRPVGTFSAAGCFSMQQSKLLTSGEGGAVITSREDLYGLLEELRCDGRRFSGEPAAGQLELTETGTVQGRNLCLSELQAAVLLDGLDRLREQNEIRAERMRVLTELIDSVDGVSLLAADPRATAPAYYNVVLRFDPREFAGNTVDAIARAVAAELGTQVNPVYVPLSRHVLLRPKTVSWGDMPSAERDRRDISRFALPEADRARRTCATLTHPVLLDDKEGMGDIAEALRKVRRHAAELRRLPQQAAGRAF